MCSYCFDLALPSTVFIQASTCFKWGKSKIVFIQSCYFIFLPSDWLGNVGVMKFSTVTHERRSLGEEYTLGGKSIALTKDTEEETCPFFSDIWNCCSLLVTMKSGEWELLLSWSRKATELLNKIKFGTELLLHILLHEITDVLTVQGNFISNPKSLWTISIQSLSDSGLGDS